MRAQPDSAADDGVGRGVDERRKEAGQAPAFGARSSGLRLLVTVTFNPNQLRAHLLPLIALDEVDSITVVADALPPPLPKVHGVVPSRTLRLTLGRAGAKLALCLRLARRERFDWVMGFNFVPHGFNAQLVARRAGSRSLYHMIGGEREWVGGGYSSDNNVLGRLRRPSPRLERFLLSQVKRATLVATMGPRARESLIARGLAPDRVAVIPPSTDVSRFSPRDGRGPYDIVSVAALLENKRLADLVDAAALVRRSHPALRVAIAGTGPLREPLEERARGRDIHSHVAFLGQVRAIEDVYGGAAAFVLTSQWEGMPIAMLDAMSAGLPVVVPDVGEIGTLVAHGRNGLIYPVGDIGALADAIERLLSDREYARRLGQQARKDVVERHSIEAVAAIYCLFLSNGDAR